MAARDSRGRFVRGAGAAQVTLNTRGLEILQGNLRALGEHVLTIGFQGPSGAQLYPTGVNMATVALYNEFGTRNIPARAFLRSTMFERRDRIESIMADAASRVLEDVSISAAGAVVESLSQAGREIVALVERKINTSKGWAKRNAPATVAKKGFDYPLHETDELARSVTWAVRRGSASGSIIAQGGSS
jgi:hypothetical protein